MLLSVIRYGKGYLRIRIQGRSAERFLNLCSFHGIFIWGLKPEEDAYEMYLYASDFRKLKPWLKKTKTRAFLLEKKGLPFFLHRSRKRKGYFAGLLLCICLICFYSRFIWDIHFEGNETRTSEVLLDHLESIRVKPGMRKSDVDCEQIVRDIRKEFGDIIWVSASVDGCRLTVRVKENDDLFGSGEEEAGSGQQETPQDLVAEKDAVIVDIVTRQGVPLVHAGDSVKAGDILVSGRVEVKDDAGEVVSYQYCRADADILGATVLEYSEELDLAGSEKDYRSRKTKTVWFLQIGDFRFASGKTKAEGKGRETALWQRQVKFGESVYLPIYYGQIRQRDYVWKEKNYTDEEIRQALSGRFARFCGELEKKGVQITENNVKIHIDENLARAAGTLSLTEPLGSLADTEILTIERDETDESVGNDD